MKNNNLEENEKEEDINISNNVNEIKKKKIEENNKDPIKKINKINSRRASFSRTFSVPASIFLEVINIKFYILLNFFFFLKGNLL